MKPYDNNIEAEVAKTMQLLDEMQPIGVHHLFRVRVMQRVEVALGQKSGRMADFRFAFIALLFIVNVSSALLSLQNSTTVPKTEFSELSDASGNDYSAQEFAYYDQTMNDPAATSENGSLTP